MSALWLQVPATVRLYARDCMDVNAKGTVVVLDEDRCHDFPLSKVKRTVEKQFFLQRDDLVAMW